MNKASKTTVWTASKRTELFYTTVDEMYTALAYYVLDPQTVTENEAW